MITYHHLSAQDKAAILNRKVQEYRASHRYSYAEAFQAAVESLPGIYEPMFPGVSKPSQRPLLNRYPSQPTFEEKAIYLNRMVLDRKALYSMTYERAFDEIRREHPELFTA